MMFIIPIPPTSNTPNEPEKIGRLSVGSVTSASAGAEKKGVFKVTCEAKQNENCLKNYISYRDDDYYYYLFELGTIYNAKLEEGDLQPYIGVDYSLTFSTSATTAETIQRYSETTATNSTKTTTHVEASVNYTHNWGTTRKTPSNVLSVGLSSGKSTENAQEVAIKNSFTETAEKANTEVKSQTFTFNSNNEQGNYCYILLGTIKVYEVVVYDPKTNASFSTEGVEILNSNRVMIFLGSQNYYDDSNARNSLTFDESVVSICSTKPEHYITEKATTQSQVICDAVVQKEEYLIDFKSDNHPGNLTREIKFGKTISELKDEGYEKIRIQVEYELAEADDCKQTIMVYNSSKTFYDKTFSHGGFSGYRTEIAGAGWEWFGWGDSKDGNWKKYNIDVTVDIQEVHENTLYFKAMQEDAWYRRFYVRNVKITVTATKEVVKIS